MIHKRGRSGGPVFFLAKNPGLWHNGQERKVRPVTSLTKRAIRASFLKLLNERPLNKITVKDIVEDCGINRNSFYYHYTDIPALAEEIVKDEAARIVQEYPTVDSLEQCLESLLMVKGSVEDGMPEDFYSIDLMNAYEQLGFIIGESVDDDVVNEIFAKFCMGK